MTDTYCIDYDNILLMTITMMMRTTTIMVMMMSNNNDDYDSMSLFNGSKRTLSYLDDIQTHLFQLNP